MAKQYLVLDYESRSECDLKKCGGAEYYRHPTTIIFCASWAFGTREELKHAQVETWSPIFGGRKAFLIEKLLDESVLIVAHNSGFEKGITKHVLSRLFKEPRLEALPPERFLCTASLAAALGLPRSLEGACSAYNLGEKKDVEGKRLILKYTKPRKATAGNSAKWHNDLNDLKRIIQYCENDVRAEVELFLKAYPLIDSERQLWILDQKINERGFEVDRELVLACLEMIEKEKALIEAKTVEISKGSIPSTTQRDKTLEWLKSEGVNLPNLQAKTIRDFLKENEEPSNCCEILRLRQSASKTSTAKFEAFEARSRFDGRCRDNLIYHGSTTGRFSGSGVQIQNLARPKTKDTDQLAEILKTKDLELIRFLYGDPMAAFSDALRSCILPSKGKELFVVDYASIEVRVLFWLSGHNEGLQAIRDGRDLYVEMAAKIYKKNPKDVTKEERAVGKAAVLGCGYSLGASKFFDTCKNFGINISEELAKVAVDTYRSVHSPVVDFWKKTAQTSVAAFQNKKEYKSGFVKWGVRDEFLYCELPSKRRLYYYKPQLLNEATPWGEMRPSLYAWATNGLTKKFEQYKLYGALAVENCLAHDTFVFTNSGLKKLRDISDKDKVFDGFNFVRHGGKIFKGKEKTICRIGIQITSDHLVSIGNSWITCNQMGVKEWLYALRWGASLMGQRLFLAKSANTLKLKYCAHVEKFLYAKLGILGEKINLNAENALMKLAALKEQVLLAIAKLFLIRKYATCGSRDTTVLCLGATIPRAALSKTTGDAGLSFSTNGKKIKNNFLSTQKHLKDGITRSSTLIGLTTIKVITQVIYVWCHVKLIAEIGVRLPSLWLKAIKSLLQNFLKSISGNGKVKIPFIITLKWERHLMKYLNTTTEVYDILNCGPRNQFMILTALGPVIVHNCTQAIARDLMCDAMIKAENAGFEVLLSVHDELIAERKTGEKQLSDFEKIMLDTPEWASGLPIAVEGFKSERYRK